MEPVADYAPLGEQRVAYQVVGDGPVDLVINAGFWGSFDVEWENLAIRLFHQRLADFARVIQFDRRGTGGSDPVPLNGLPPWEAFAEEIEAVLDAVGSERAALMAIADAGPVGLLFAATRPERTTALILFNTTARIIEGDDYPIGVSQGEYDAMATAGTEGWGTSSQSMSRFFLPSQDSDPRALQWMTKLQRAITSPTAVLQFVVASAEADARPLLSSITVPTLVFHRVDSPFIPLEHGRYLAEHIDGAKLVELEGGDSVPYFEHPEATLSAVEQFIGDTNAPAITNRLLASLLFTDIVDSTRRARDVGDHHWKTLLDLHDDLSEEVAVSYGGRLVKSTGDGVLALFDGPGRAIRAANKIQERLNQVGLPIRAGVHTGEVELRGDDVGGIAVHLAARVMAEAKPGEILVSSTVRDLVAGSGIGFIDQGVHALKGIDGNRQLYAVDLTQRVVAPEDR